MPDPVIRSADEIEYEAQSAAEGLAKGVLIGEDQDAPNFRMRRFTLEADSSVPRHTNEVEHEQYVLDGQYIVGLERPDGTEVEYEVEPGDALLIPAGTVHWYRNQGEEAAAFICVVPNGEDEIQVVE